MTARLTLHDRHAALGARFAPFAGYEMPMRYTTIKDEHRAVRERVGVFDVSHMGEVFVRGADAVLAVDRLVTNDMTRLADGQALYTAMCTPDGGIVDDLIIYRRSAEEVLIVVNAANRDGDVAWIREHITGDVRVDDESDRWAQIAVQGPSALSVVAALAPDAAELKTFYGATMNVAGVEAWVSRTGYTGEDGVEIYAAQDDIVSLFDALMAAGEAHGIQAIGLGARDTLRLEARLMLYGNDIDRSTSPLEAGLGWVVKFTERPFIGKDALAEQKQAGLRRRLRGLTLEGRGVLRAGYEVFASDERVGVTTSGGVAPSLDDASIGLAYIDVPHHQSERLEVEIRGRRVPVRLSTKPFYRRPAKVTA